jgi:hypothetical protein
MSFAVPARAWRCSLVGQPNASGAPSDSPVFGRTSRDESPDMVTACEHAFYSHDPTRKTYCRLTNALLGPYGTNIFDPRSWGNGSNESINNITLEFTRVVIGIGVFAVGVELPKKYMYRHWKSLFFLLVPVMTWVRSTHSFSKAEAD